MNNNKKTKKTTFPREILGYLVWSILFGGLLFSGLFAGNWYLYKKMIQPQTQTKDFETAKEEFQKFVTSNKANSHGRFTWQSSTGTVFYMRNDSDFATKPDFQKESENPTGQRKPIGTEKSTTIDYTDSEVWTTFLVVENLWPYYIGVFISIVVSLMVTLFLFYRQLLKKANYMRKIEEGTFILESGDLTYKIIEEGNDELSQIAISLNRMSQSLSEKIVSEAKATQASREIISDLSHDIRTPLTILTGYLPVVLETDLTEEQRKYLNLIHKKTQQMNDRVNDLLEYATIFSGQQPLELQDIEIGLFLDQFVTELLPIAQVDYQTTVPLHTLIVGDRKLLERLWDNLISNIHQHGDLKEEIQVKAKFEEKWVKIKIQNEVGEESESYGKSLGVKIAAMIAELHGGELTSQLVESHYISNLKLPIKAQEDQDSQLS